jgi:hypothetical protein
MNWPSRAAVAAIILLPAVVTAEPLLSFGPDVPLFLTASVSVRHDDNVFLSPTDKVSDTIYLFAPGLDLHFSGSQANAGITFSEQFSRYAKNHDLDDQLANLVANVGYHGSETTFGVVGSYVQTDQTTTTATNLDQTVKQSIESVAVNTEVEMTAKTKLGVTPSFTRVEFPEAGFTDSDIWTVPVDLYYGVTPKTDVSVGYAYSRTKTQNGSGDANSSFVNVGARGQFTPKLSGQVRVGISELKPEVGPSTSQLGLETTLSYAYSPKTSFSLYANNGFAPSAAGNQTEVFSTGLSGTFLLSNAWSASISAGTSSTKYLITPPRTDHFWDGTISVSYIVTSNLDLQASYLYRKNASTLQALTFDDNLLTLTAACRF